jgi:DNA primase
MTLKANRPSQELVEVVAALRGKWHGSYAMCLCPAHADGEPSLSLRQENRGIVVHCFAGCQADDVLRELRRVRPVLGTAMLDYRQPAGTGM